MQTPVRIAIVGAGAWMQRVHLPVLRRLRDEGVLLPIGVNSRTTANARLVADALGASRIYGTLDELMADTEVDAVSVIVNRHVVFPILMRIAEAGKPVMTEKPQANTVEEAEILADRYSDIPNLVGFNRRYAPLHQRMKQEMERLNGVHWVECEIARRRRADPRYVTETGIHAINLLEWLLGPISSVRATTDSAPDGVVLHWIAELVFSNGVTGRCAFFPQSGRSMERYAVHARDATLRLNSAQSFTDDGQSLLTVDHHNDTSPINPTRTQWHDESDDEVINGGFLEQYREFCMLATGEIAARSSLQNAVNTLRIAHAIEAAAPR